MRLVGVSGLINFEGFQLDRGFQVFPTAYPEAREVLDYPTLKLQYFYSGAMVHVKGEFHRLSNPLRHPFQAVQSCLAPIGSLADKIRVVQWAKRARGGSIQEMFQKPESSGLQLLKDLSFSPSIIEQFFRPFLGGIFLNRQLETSSRMVEFVFRMFAAGETALPAEGMNAIPQQMASRLGQTRLQIESRVISIQGTTLRLESNETLRARALVLATDGQVGAKLIPDLHPPACHPVACLYYSASEPPLTGPYLILNGDGSGPINNLCILSQVAPSYAPPNQQLLSISVINPIFPSEAALEVEVRRQLVSWFGIQAKDWRHLRTYVIPNAQPAHEPPAINPWSLNTKLRDGLYICGDHRSTGNDRWSTFIWPKSG